MQLNSIFQLPVSRPIEGVIKADDETSLYVELDEYVLTDEVAKRLAHFPPRQNTCRLHRTRLFLTSCS